MIDEIDHATDGALRVSRRQLLRAFEESRKANDRLELDEHGDPTREGVDWKVSSVSACAMQAVEQIEKELDDRDADYRPRRDVMG